MRVMRRKGLICLWLGWRFQLDIRWARGERVTVYLNLNA